MPDVVWPLSSKIYNSASAVFTDMIRDSDLTQLVDFPTRFRGTQSPSLLDLILVNDTDIVSNIEQHPPFGKSDHVVIRSTLLLKFPSANNIATKSIKITDYEKLVSLTEGVDWVSLLQPAADVEVMWNSFAETLLGLYDCCTVTKDVSFIPTKPWINAEILRQIRHKRSIWRRYVRGRKRRDYDAHRAFSSYLSATIKNAKREYELKIARSKDRKKFFKYVRSTLNSKVDTPLVYDQNNKLCSGPEESANVLADSFAASFTHETGQLPRMINPRLSAELSDVIFSPSIVETHLSALKVDSSPGSDGISSRLLKECAHSISLPLSLIFARSFATSSLPSDWKSARVTPIFKKGNKRCAANYRPISLVPIVAKVCERVIHGQVLQFALGHNLIPRCQHGFLPGRSVITNLLDCVDAWSMSLDRDDTKLFGNPTSAGIIQDDLDSISRWCQDWQLPLNSDKCVVLHMGARNPRYQYLLNGIPIPVSSSHSDLGVIVTDTLSWSEHISQTVSRAKRSLFLLQKSFDLISGIKLRNGGDLIAAVVDTVRSYPANQVAIGYDTVLGK
ncbi:uncharacterized protein LOC123306927 [Coccinella septempunctata]|uniref:uncharacterized protein LOC123306927 n=1 Tax=Coccinella septempunctata TaxID=41139 RepID=UPI001D064382|nr:uncharacterized protein LOC123306927 [Coccinella septempunctata]